MGRMIRKEVIGFRCNLTSCGAKEFVSPRPVSVGWSAHLVELDGLVQRGWTVVVTSKLRTYCPLHADNSRACICKTHPLDTHLCAVHSSDVRESVWDVDYVPLIVRSHLMKKSIRKVAQ